MKTCAEKTMASNKNVVRPRLTKDDNEYDDGIVSFSATPTTRSERTSHVEVLLGRGLELLSQVGCRRGINSPSSYVLTSSSCYSLSASLNAVPEHGMSKSTFLCIYVVRSFLQIRLRYFRWVRLLLRDSENGYAKKCMWTSSETGSIRISKHLKHGRDRLGTTVKGILGLQRQKETMKITMCLISKESCIIRSRLQTTHDSKLSVYRGSTPHYHAHEV